VRDYFPEVDLLSLGGWIWMVRGGMFESLFFSVPPSEIGGHLHRLAVQLLANCGVLPAVLSLTGLVAGLAGSRRHRQFTIGCLLLFVCHSGFYLAYGALDANWMYSVSYLIGALLFGLGLVALEERLKTVRGRRPAHVPLFLGLVTGVLIVRLAWFNCAYVDLGDDISARTTGEQILATMEPDALFIGMWEHVPILEYLQIVEQQRPDVQLVNGVFVGPTGSGQLVQEAHHQGRPVYTTATNLFAGRFLFIHLPEGLCYRVHTRDPARIAQWPPVAP